MTQGVVEFEAALALVLRQASAVAELRMPATERVRLLDAAGRVLARDVAADRDQPYFNRSTRDGFALRASEWVAGAKLQVRGQVRAGEIWHGPEIGPADAVQIMTGAPVPEGCDAVAMVEHVNAAAGTISPAGRGSLRTGENVVLRGSEAKRGQVVLPAGVRAGAAEIALAASCGCGELEVFARPRVAIVATGDELVELDQTPQAHQIRNSNGYAIAALVARAGGTPDRLPIARDTRGEVRDRIVRGRKADLLILSGGVSMGDYDLVEEVLAELDAEFFFTGVRMQPGRPAVFGRLPADAANPECCFFGLPGNPVSTQVTFHCLAEPFLRVLGGETAAAPPWAAAILAADVAARDGLTRLLPARMEGTAVQLVPWQGSGDLAANARSNCYAELVPGRAYTSGEVVRVLLR